MFKKINRAIYQLLTFTENIVKCDKCKHLINKEDAVDGGDEIRVKITESHCGFFYKREKYIAEIKLCPRCAAEIAVNGKTAIEKLEEARNKFEEEQSKRIKKLKK